MKPSALIVLVIVGVMAAGWSVLGAASSAAASSLGKDSLSCEIGNAATPPASEPPVATADVTRSPELWPVIDVPLPGGASRFDYQSLDETTGRLYIAHMGAGQLVVFDTATQQVVGTIDNLPTVTGVLVVPELHHVFASVAGDHQVAVIDTERLQVVARIGEIGFPDGLAYVPAVQQIFVSDESGGGELVIDATTNQVTTTIDIGGEAGNTHYDPVSGCVLVAVQTSRELVALDPATHQLVGRYKMDEACQAPHGFLIDGPRRLAFVTCEENATLLVVDLQIMAVTGSYPVGDGPDVLAFDPGWRQLYVASESGLVAVFAEQDDATLRRVGEISAQDAHSVSVDPTTHLVYLPLPDVDGRPVLRIVAATPPPEDLDNA